MPRRKNSNISWIKKKSKYNCCQGEGLDSFLEAQELVSPGITARVLGIQSPQSQPEPPVQELDNLFEDFTPENDFDLSEVAEEEAGNGFDRTKVRQCAEWEQLRPMLLEELYNYRFFSDSERCNFCGVSANIYRCGTCLEVFGTHHYVCEEHIHLHGEIGHRYLDKVKTIPPVHA